LFYLGLVNGARLIVNSLSANLLQLRFLSGVHKDKMVFLPRIQLQPTDTDYPFVLNRLQFPVINAFALTINKSQGQSFEKVGIYLSANVFSHGQLYVAFSRATTKKGVIVQIKQQIMVSRNILNNKNFTYNCVYREVYDDSLFL
jgi:ATP-dependent DNA helicase PIF1